MARARSISEELLSSVAAEYVEEQERRRTRAAIVLHASVAAGCALGSLLLSVGAYEVWSVDAAVRSARVVAAATSAVADGELIAVTGRADAAAGSEPVLSMNKDAALFLESTLTLRSSSVFGGPAASTVVSRRVRAVDADMTLQDGPMLALDAYGQSVHASTVRLAASDVLAATASPQKRNVRVPVLVSGGGRITPPRSSWFMFAAKLLLGRVDEELVEKDAYLPTGATLTAIGTAAVHDGAVALRPHAVLGIMLLLGEGTAALLARNATRWRWAAGGAVALAAIAVWQGVTAWRAAQSSTWAAHARDGDEIGGDLEYEYEASSAAQHTPSQATSLSPSVSIVDASDVLAPSRDMECVACQERQQVACLVPCGHVALCMTCARRLRHAGVPQERRCPICRHAISDVVRVYGASVHTPPPAAPVATDAASALVMP